MAMSGYPRGHRVAGEALPLAPNIPIDTHPRTQVPQNRTRHRRENFPGRERSGQGHSELFVASDIGRRTRLSPNGQRDRGNLPRQSETRHLRPDPFGEQSLVELPERTLPDGGLDRRALEQIFEMVIVTGIELAHRYRPLRSFQPPLDIPVPSSCCSGAAIVVGQ